MVNILRNEVRKEFRINEAEMIVFSFDRLLNG